MERIRTWDFRGTVTPPCLDCPNRKVGCHSNCEEYKSYRQQLQDDKEKKLIEDTEYFAQFKCKEIKRQL